MATPTPKTPAARAISSEPVRVTIDLKGHGTIARDGYAPIRAKAEELVALCTAAGIPLSGGFQPAELPPDPGELPPPIEPPPGP